jgi:acyl-CoA thioester hydrolase
MGIVHHSRYAVYFEEARTELLRSRGLTYRDIEASGRFLVVTDLAVKFRRPCRLGDELEIECRVTEASYVTVSHEYAVRIAGNPDVAVEARTRLACITADGRPARLPDELLSMLNVS